MQEVYDGDITDSKTERENYQSYVARENDKHALGRGGTHSFYFTLSFHYCLPGLKGPGHQALGKP